VVDSTDEDYACDDEPRGLRMRWVPPLPSRRTLLIGAGAGALVLLIAVAAWAWYDAQQRRMQAAYAEVLLRVQVAEAPDAPAETRLAAARDLDQLLTRYPSARAVPQAAYELGNLRFGARDYAGARAAYTLAVQRGAAGLVRALARSGIGRAWEAERDFSQAAEAYAALVKDLDARSFLYEDALIDQARALELAGRKPEAVAAYERVLKDVPTARRADEIRMRLAALGTAVR
jgi:tetratricopeptide (TPR) repeat protein